MAIMMLFKVLNGDGTCYNGGNGSWHLPVKNPDGSWTAGEWMPAIQGDLEPCSHGYHLCREQDLLRWLGPAIFEAEYRGEMIEAEDKIVVREARLLRQVETWTERTARLFACDCAERVVDLCGDDPRPRRAIDVARRYAGGEAVEAEELDVARDFGWAGAWATARAAAHDAAWATARACAWDAARAASRAASWAAAWAGAWAGAWDAEQEYQSARLMEYLGNGA